MDYFIVELNNDQKIAIPLDKVQEVMSISYNDICPIPGVKESLLGIVSQRGNLLWLLDLSRLLYNFRLLNNSYSSSTILVTKLEENYIGLVVKKLGEIKDLVLDNSFDVSQQNAINSHNNFCVNTKNSIAIIDLIQIENYLK
ncbi:hypothetical protein GM3708_89 [Geminocystis sp. NIES-3708]|uniref:chemotaxis protein CheW n=1 Tax=Geminocystis sp. NIES-3708 TaxID=1615909 RepID=UPI0005FC8F4A|nr:chemotaxis protein CheW [Geminocystis sp. NIES-3708]BAQ59684.1 hypothetical protein GM3708_89 [Geminocystis sp. NIES-3708]